MSEAIKKDSVYVVMQKIYSVLKKRDVITDVFLQRAVHFDASTKARADQLTEEDKVIWYMVLMMYKMIFDKAGNYYKYKEQDPEKFHFLNGKRPFYQSINRVDLTRAYMFEQSEKEIKEMNFQGLEQKTGVLLDPKELANFVRTEIIKKTKEM